MKLLLFSEYPSLENPDYFSFIRSRVHSLSTDYKITVVTIKHGSQANKVNVLYDKGVRVYSIELKFPAFGRFNRLFFEVLIRNKIKNILPSVKPDIVEIHFSSFYSWIMGGLCRKHNIPYLIVEHATFFEEKVKKPWNRRLIANALNKANSVVAVSESLKSVIEKYTYNDIKVIPNMVDTENFTYKKRLFPNGIPSIISVGSFEYNDKKGYEILIDALKMVRDEGFVFRMTIIGSGPNTINIFRKIDNYNLNDSIEIIGNISNDKLSDYLNKAHFFVSSSRRETFGVAIIEAMACGLPVLVTKSGGPEEYVTKELGIVVENNSVFDLYNGVKYMLENYSSYDTDEIRKHIIMCFSGYVYRKRMTTLYEKILRENNAII